MMHCHIAFQASRACDVCRISGEYVTSGIQIHEDNIKMYLKKYYAMFGLNSSSEYTTIHFLGIHKHECQSLVVKEVVVVYLGH